MHITSPGLLSDSELIDGMQRALGREREQLVTFLLLLGELESRGLHWRCGASNVFQFLTERMKLSEPSASRRLAAARLLRRYPEIVAMVRSGDLQLTGMSLLSRHLNDTNKDQLLDAARGASHRALEAMLAKDFGPAPIRDVIRPVAFRPPGTSVLAAKQPTGPGPSSATMLIDRQGGTITPPPCAPDYIPKQTAPTHSATAFRISVTLDPTTSVQFQWILESLPGRGPGDIIRRAIDMLFVHRQKNALLGRAQRGRFDKGQSKEKSESDGDGFLAQPGVHGFGAHDETAGPQSRHERRPIPAAVRHTVALRDGGQCTWVSPAGCRCTSRHDLQFDHITPIAHGGATTVDNLRLLCGPHNRLAAMDLMGRDFITARMAAGRTTRARSK